MNNLLRRWFEFRAALRRWSWLDYLEGAVLALWGAAAILRSEQVLYHSHFTALSGSIGIAGLISLLIGIAQIVVAATHSERGRMITGFLGLWVMTALWISVDSITGKIGWGGHVGAELLISLALVP